MYFHKSEAEGDYTEKVGRQCDWGNGDWSDWATGQGMLAASRS